MREIKVPNQRKSVPSSVGRKGEDRASTTEPAVELSQVTKRYGPTVALDSVTLQLATGAVTALFGENGAGKSTLFSVLAGAVHVDAGEVRMFGQRYAPRTPREALGAGVALVAQELSPCPSLTVAENIVLGGWPTPRGVTSARSMMRRAAELTDRFGVELPLRRRVADVTVGEMQLIEILRVLNRDVRMVLLDEPTAALTAGEAELVLGLVRRLAAEGVTVALVTHRIEEALAVADHVAVLRGGQVELSASRSQVTSEIIVEQMLGRPLKPRVDTVVSGGSRPDALRLEDWTRSGPDGLRGVSFVVPQGAIVGLYGVRGSGIESVASGLAGVGRIDSGTTRVGKYNHGKGFPTPRARERAGLRFVPNDRAGTGLALRLPTSTNLLFPLDRPALRTGIWRNKRAERTSVADLIGRYRIASGYPWNATIGLSGGNQQKVLMASRLEGDYQVLVVHEPTRGVDLGAREAIHDAIREIAAQGRGVLVISSDVDEIVELAHEAVVLRAGQVAGRLAGSDLVIEQLLYAATAESNQTSTTAALNKEEA